MTELKPCPYCKADAISDRYFHCGTMELHRRTGNAGPNFRRGLRCIDRCLMQVQKERDEALARITELEKQNSEMREGIQSLCGCGDSSCTIRRPTGMATNGGCRCGDITVRNRNMKIAKMMRAVNKGGK